MSTMPGEKLIGLRYRASVRLLLQNSGRKARENSATAAHNISPGASCRPISSPSTPARASSIKPRLSARSISILLQAEQARFVDGEGPPLICSVAPDGTFTAETPDYQRPLGQRLRPRHHPPTEGRGPALPSGAIPPRLSVLLAGRRRSADPVSAQKLVHPHDGLQGEDAGQQQPHQLAAGTHPRRAFRQFFGNQRRLGPFPRALLGHAAADLGLRKDRLHRGRRQLRRTARQAGRARAPKFGKRPRQENPDLPDDLKVHKPYIDAITYDSPKAPGARMRRVPEVIDCWFDSGAMPFAQWGYPHQPGSAERFRGQFPADFISEALDQTRGWFYSLLAISTLLFGEEDEAARLDADSPRPLPTSPVPRPSPLVPRLSPSFPQLHRARADARRRRRQDVEEQAELPRAERNFRPLRGRRPAVVLLRQPAAVDLDPLQRAGHQGLHSRVPAAAVERLQFLRDLREHRRVRSGGARSPAPAGQLDRRRAGRRPRVIGPSTSGRSWTAGS